MSNFFLIISKKEKIAKFYFIVDRLDLLNQASNEFRDRGLIVHHINSKEDFAIDIKKSAAIHNSKGKLEITVVNIQKFYDDPSVTKSSDYNLGVQRIFFRRVHRSYIQRLSCKFRGIRPKLNKLANWYAPSRKTLL